MSGTEMIELLPYTQRADLNLCCHSSVLGAAAGGGGNGGGTGMSEEGRACRGRDGHVGGVHLIQQQERHRPCSPTRLPAVGNLTFCLPSFRKPGAVHVGWTEDPGGD